VLHTAGQPIATAMATIPTSMRVAAREILGQHIPSNSELLGDKNIDSVLRKYRGTIKVGITPESVKAERDLVHKALLGPVKMMLEIEPALYSLSKEQWGNTLWAFHEAAMSTGSQASKVFKVGTNVLAWHAMVARTRKEVIAPVPVMAPPQQRWWRTKAMIGLWLLTAFWLPFLGGLQLCNNGQNTTPMGGLCVVWRPGDQALVCVWLQCAGQDREPNYYTEPGKVPGH
jgi:hypothetical protein